MNVTLIGVIMMLVIIVLLAKKVPMIPTFIIVPIVTLFLMGYKPADFPDLLQKGVFSSVTGTGLLLMFSITFFATLTETGMFDRIVNVIVRATKGNVYFVLLSTVLVATVGQLDGSLVTTYLIAIPALAPLYDRMKLDKRYLLLLTALVTAGFEPEWSGALQMFLASSSVSAHDVSRHMIPVMLIIYGIMLVCCFLFGRRYVKKQGGAAADLEALVSQKPDQAASPYLRPKLFWVNVGLVVGVILCLMVSGLPTYVTFMIFLALAMMINYPKSKDQAYIIKKYASTYLNPIMIIVSIGVLVGMMGSTGITSGIANAVISIVPQSIAKYTFIIFALLLVPICQVVPYQVYLALLPFIVAIEQACGMDPVVVMSAFGCNLFLGTVCSRYVAQTHLGVGLINTQGDDPDDIMNSYVKFAFPTCMIINVVVIVLSMIFGVY